VADDALLPIYDIAREQQDSTCLEVDVHRVIFFFSSRGGQSGTGCHVVEGSERGLRAQHMQEEKVQVDTDDEEDGDDDGVELANIEEVDEPKRV
jgi:hypothetical protein